MRCAGLLGQELALEVGFRVITEGNTRETALLRAVVHKPVLADVEIARPRPAAPVVRLAGGDGFLEFIETRVIALLPVAHLEVNPALLVLKRLELAIAIVNDPNRRRKAQF